MSKTHQMSNTRFYKIFSGINKRCNNKHDRIYKYYGGKGVRCLWKSFEEFKNDMYDNYLKHVNEFGEKQTTIDRINSNGNYCKENCRWATMKEQNNNTSQNVMVTFNGKTQTLVDWSKIIGISRRTLYSRICVYKWSVDRALTTKLCFTGVGKKKLP